MMDTITIQLGSDHTLFILMMEHEPEILLSYDATPGAAETVNEWISCGHEVSIITGRPSSVYEPSNICDTK